MLCYSRANRSEAVPGNQPTGEPAISPGTAYPRSLPASGHGHNRRERVVAKNGRRTLDNRRALHLRRRLFGRGKAGSEAGKGGDERGEGGTLGRGHFARVTPRCLTRCLMPTTFRSRRSARFTDSARWPGVVAV